MYELVNQPDFPSVKMGKKILIPEKEFQDFLKRYMYKNIPFNKLFTNCYDSKS